MKTEINLNAPIEEVENVEVKCDCGKTWYVNPGNWDWATCGHCDKKLSEIKNK